MGTHSCSMLHHNYGQSRPTCLLKYILVLLFEFGYMHIKATQNKVKVSNSFIPSMAYT